MILKVKIEIMNLYFKRI